MKINKNDLEIFGNILLCINSYSDRDSLWNPSITLLVEQKSENIPPVMTCLNTTLHENNQIVIKMKPKNLENQMALKRKSYDQYGQTLTIQNKYFPLSGTFWNKQTITKVCW